MLTGAHPCSTHTMTVTVVHIYFLGKCNMLDPKSFTYVTCTSLEAQWKLIILYSV